MPSFEIPSRRCSGNVAYRSASTSGHRRFVSIVEPTDDVIESPSVATVSTCRGAVTIAAFRKNHADDSVWYAVADSSAA
jgi:hypothetical protein